MCVCVACVDGECWTGESVQPFDWPILYKGAGSQLVYREGEKESRKRGSSEREREVKAEEGRDQRVCVCVCVGVLFCDGSAA